MELRLLGVGAYREGYKIKNSDVVIKFPLRSNKACLEDSIQHTAQEMRRLRRLKKDGAIGHHLPEVFYYSPKTGVIAMRYYRNFSNFEEQADAMGVMIGQLISRLTHIKCSDVHTENVRRGAMDRAILIDLGL